MIPSRATIEYFAGLDLGQAQEFTALAVLEKTTLPNDGYGERPLADYALRHLERFALGTPYPEIGNRLAKLFAESPLANSMLVVDQTGVGKPVLDMLRRCQIKAQLRPLTVTGGHKAISDDLGGWLVPKQELVSTLQVLLQSRRLKIAHSMAEAQTLAQELLNFKMKVPLAASNDPLLAWREGQHDDLVLAAASAAWMAERRKGQLMIWT